MFFKIVTRCISNAFVEVAWLNLSVLTFGEFGFSNLLQFFNVVDALK